MSHITHPGNPLISVITPFFNTADALARCIESVLGQTYGNFEYILADNCSDDGSGEIARQYALRDSRIRFKRFEELLPQVPNYNRALREISPAARYCKVVQADDFIFPDCLTSMIALARRYPSAGIISSARDLDGIIDPDNWQQIPEFMSGAAICRATLKGDVFAFGSPTTVMYRADLVRAKLDFYRKEAFFDDVEAVFDLLKKADFAFSHDVLSHTSRDPNSTLGRILSYDISPLSQLISIHTAGESFYSATELKRAKREIEVVYYDHLLRACLRRPDRWRYLGFHKSTLWNSASLRISFTKVAYCLLRKLSLRLARKFAFRSAGISHPQS